MFQHCLCGLSVRQVAKQNFVSPSTVERLVYKYRTTGEVVSLQDKHGPDIKLSSQEELIVLELFLSKPGIYLREVQQELFDATRTWVHCSTLCRTAKPLGLTKQKMRRVAIRRSDVVRAEYMSEMSAFDPNMLVFIDETGSVKCVSMAMVYEE